MNRILFTLSLGLVFGLTACTEDSTKAPNYQPPGVLFEEEEVPDYSEGLPQPNSDKPIAYEQATYGADRPYWPITVEYSSGTPPITKWTKANTRLLAYIIGYERQISTYEEYQAITNQYGSYTAGERQAATGRFYVKKVGDRWWIIDPEGYPYYMRGVCSFRKGSSARNKAAFASRFTDDMNWVNTSRNELARTGFHQTGAFSTDGYKLQQQYNASNASTPFPLAPSFGFLSQFQSKKSKAYPGGDSENAVGLVLYDDWGAFCLEYMQSSAFATYIGDKNFFGFFSDNEINFSSMNSKILQRFLDINNANDIACKAAQDFMASKGATTVTDALNSEFAGMLAEKYYKGVRDAINVVDPAMLYLGTRLHGTPKYLEGVITAAGKYCDIISINYYSRWSPEADWMQKWDALAPDAPFMVTEFYTKGIEDSDLSNASGAGFAVHNQNDRAYAYQHFTLGLLEAKNCVGWHWFKYQDDDGSDNSNKPANKGLYDNQYQLFPYLAQMAREVNYNVYNLTEFFDNQAAGK